MTDMSALLDGQPRAGLLGQPTPLEQLERLSGTLELDLRIKRDDLTGLGFGGNKIRQLEYYFGAAQAAEADTVLITGAVQSNYVRCTAAAAAKLGMKAILQLEERVPGMSAAYRQSGNVLLDQLLGAEIMQYPDGEDEAGADAALRARADEERRKGRKPYVIPLGLDNPPRGALGYMRAAEELLGQARDIDAVVVASGSGLTHAGLLAGLRLSGCNVPVWGSCVRRGAEAQTGRLLEVQRRLADLLHVPQVFAGEDINLWDGALAPGYGRLSDAARRAAGMMAHQEGLFLDPVYTAKSFAAVPGLMQEGILSPGMRVIYIHTGGLPALFAYAPELSAGFNPV